MRPPPGAVPVPAGLRIVSLAERAGPRRRLPAVEGEILPGIPGDGVSGQ